MFSPQHARVQPPALNRAAPFLPGRVGRRDDSGGSSLCVGPFHSTPSSRTAASATATRRARAVNEISKTIIDTARVEVDFIKTQGEGCSDFISPPDVVALSEPGNGIVGIVRHQLRG